MQMTLLPKTQSPQNSTESTTNYKYFPGSEVSPEKQVLFVEYYNEERTRGGERMVICNIQFGWRVIP